MASILYCSQTNTKSPTKIQMQLILHGNALLMFRNPMIYSIRKPSIMRRSVFEVGSWISGLKTPAPRFLVLVWEYKDQQTAI